MRKEEKLVISLLYFSQIQEIFSPDWDDYKGYRLTHIVCLDALALAGAKLLVKSLNQENKPDYSVISRYLKKIRKFDWSSEGNLKFLKGINGSKSLAEELKTLMMA
jgi:DNA sulfur modification protein DndB